MPRLVDWVVDCCIYLYPSEADANRGERIGGSGFLFGIPTADEFGTFVYAVSNWHVVRTNPVIRLNTTDGKFEVIPLTVDDWHRHPDGETDLAVALIDLSKPSRYLVRVINHTHLLTRDWIRKFGVGIGDDLFVVGRFVDHDGIQRNQPTVRFGAIAQMPGEPIATTMGRQDAYLAELRSISGYSGSPVFALIPFHRDGTLSPEAIQEIAMRPNAIGGKERMLLVGVDCGHTRYMDQDVYEDILDDNGERVLRPTNQWVSVNTGIAIVIAAWKLDELLQSEDLQSMRNDVNLRREKAASGTKLDIAEPRLQKTLAHKKADRIDIPIVTHGQFDSDLTKAIRKRNEK
jgi:hypothetical protein